MSESEFIVEKILRDEIRNGRTPSVQFAFFNDEAIIYEFSEGYANIEHKLNISRSAIFPIFSITKTFRHR
jgi:CubicO group peptidase (beta-lactamase class C family)